MAIADAAEPSEASAETKPGGDLSADIRALRTRLPTLEAVERRRGQLWSIAGLLLLAASVTVGFLLLVPEAADTVPDNTGVRVGFAALSFAFLLYVFDQERRMRRLSHALIDERVLTSALEGRVRDLATLSRVGRVANSVLTTEDVLHIILEGAFELTGAVTGSVMLVDGDELVVEVSSGRDPAPPGSRQPVRLGVAGRVADTREPLLIMGQVGEGQIDGRRPRGREAASSMVAPMLVADELIGILALERPPDAEAFTQWELRAVALFADHAATAVSNARRYEEERHNVQRLADMLERRSEFVASLVHDLKSPLTAILGFSGMLRKRGDLLDGEKRANLLGRLDSSARDLLDMIDTILRSASSEAVVPFKPEPVPLEPFLENLADTARHAATSRDGTERRVTIEAPPGLTVQTDPRALHSVLQNLLENAVKYSPPGSTIDLAVTEADNELRIAVSDQGAGIAEDELEVIFERFRRRRATDTTEGVGLGLYIARSMVVAMGGRIWVESEVGRGSTFHVVIPQLLSRQKQPG